MLKDIKDKNHQRMLPEKVQVRDFITYLVKQTQSGGSGVSGKNLQSAIQHEKLTELLYE